MNKSSRNGLIILGMVIVVFMINQYLQNKHTTKSDVVFDGSIDDVTKILVQKGDDAIELIKNNEIWEIAGNDTMLIRQNRLDNLFNTVLSVERETLVSENYSKWKKFSVDDSMGTHLALIDDKGNTTAYLVFGRSKIDWSHNYIRLDQDPEVYLTNTSVIHHLSTSLTFWGEVPKTEEVDSAVVTDPLLNTPLNSTEPVNVQIGNTEVQTIKIPVPSEDTHESGSSGNEQIQ